MTKLAIICCIVFATHIVEHVECAFKTYAKNIYVGVLMSAGSTYFADADVQKLVKEQYNCVTPGNDMKWSTIENTKGKVDYSAGDKLVAFAQSNSMKVRGHTLVWHTQIPSWLDSLSKTELNTTLKSHIEGEVGHWKGKLYAWDVLNEIFNEDGTMRNSIWYKNFGKEYVTDAFNWAHAIDPSVKLYINDYNVEGVNKKSDGLYNLVSELVKAKVPIHGVGLQGHFELGHTPSTADIEANMKRFAALGLDVAMTELEVKIKLPATDDKLQQQGKEYAQVFTACLAVPKCVGVSITGISDKITWDVGAGYGAAIPFDENFKPKPAVAAIENVLKG